MNVTCRLRSEIVIIGLGMAGFLLSATLGSAQTRPENPLRPPKAKVTRESDAPLQQDEPGLLAQYEVRQASARVQPSQRRIARNTAYYGGSTPRHQTPGFVPRHTSLSARSVGIQEEILTEPIPQEALSLEPLPAEGEMFANGGCADCGGAVDSCGTCGTCGGGCLIPCPVFSFQNIEIFGGVQGFTAEPNRGETGSFGFHYGLNWGAPLRCFFGGAVGAQLGYRGVSSNFSGASFTSDSRHQSFVTGGLFRRVDWGLQGGVVVDFMRDNWYYDLSLAQLRGELSWVYPACHELGFWFASSTRTTVVDSTILQRNQLVTIRETFEPTDLFAFFYRRRFEAIGGGYAKVSAGFSGESDGLIAADFKLPLTPDWALQTGFTYLIPGDDNTRISHVEEAWNVAITVIWYPGGRKAVGNDYYRPLFDVADNGNFITRFVR